MFDFLLDSISDSPATYLALAGIIFVDDFVPFAPGDTAMITAGILAANGELMLVLVIAAGAVGGILGDNLFYFLGRYSAPASPVACCAATAPRMATAGPSAT